MTTPDPRLWEQIWVSATLGQARGLVEVGLTGPDRDAAEGVLSALDRRRDELTLLGAEAFEALLARSQTDPTDEDLTWLEREASFAERRAASHASSEAAHREAERRREAARAVRRALLELGSEALRLAVPFLLAVIRRAA